jgi:hypothetical protein
MQDVGGAWVLIARYLEVVTTREGKAKKEGRRGLPYKAVDNERYRPSSRWDDDPSD